MAIFHTFAPMVALFAAIYILSWWPLIAYVFLVIAVALAGLRYIPLHPVTVAAVQQERLLQKVLLGTFVALMVVSAFIR